MEILRSRQNEKIRRLLQLSTDPEARRAAGEYLCAGHKLLQEAVASGAEVTQVLWTEPVGSLPCLLASAELVGYVSPLKTNAGPVFTVRMPSWTLSADARRVVILENLQDPGNVGTVMRTAEAFGMDAVLLVGACADPFGPKTVRATMGAVFRLPVLRAESSALREALPGFSIYGAALAEDTRDIRSLGGERVAVAVGNEGSGLTPALLSVCDAAVKIPMPGRAESLNAAVAASIAMWEMVR